MGLYHRIGSLDLGKDADVVVWDRNPMKNNARPKKVFVEGNLLVDKNYKNKEAKFNVNNNQLRVAEGTAGDSYAFKGSLIYTMNNQVPFRGDIVVTNGTISCIDLQCNVPNDYTIYSW